MCFLTLLKTKFFDSESPVNEWINCEDCMWSLMWLKAKALKKNLIIENYS
jgi:hypothetical protein